MGNTGERKRVSPFDFVFLQSLSRARLSVTAWTAACQTSLSFTISQSLLKLISIEPMMLSNHLSVTPFSSCPQSSPASGSFAMNQLFASKYWSFSFSISPSNEYSGLIDWFDLLAVQGNLESLLQHHSSKASILQHLVFFMVQLSHPYMATGKTIALTIWTFVGKLMSLLFNILSRFFIAALPRSERLLISQLQSPSTVILEPKKIKSVIASTFPPFYLP